MTRRILAIVIALMLVMTAACAETLRVGMECNYAPFNWTQTNETEIAVPLAGGGYADSEHHPRQHGTGIASDNECSRSRSDSH